MEEDELQPIVDQIIGGEDDGLGERVMVGAERGVGEQQRRDPKVREEEEREVAVGETAKGGVGGGQDAFPMDIPEERVEGRVGVSHADLERV